MRTLSSLGRMFTRIAGAEQLSARPPTIAEAARAMSKQGHDRQHARIIAKKAELDRDFANGITAPLGPRPMGRGR